MYGKALAIMTFVSGAGSCLAADQICNLKPLSIWWDALSAPITSNSSSMNSNENTSENANDLLKRIGQRSTFTDAQSRVEVGAVFEAGNFLYIVSDKPLGLEVADAQYKKDTGGKNDKYLLNYVQVFNKGLHDSIRWTGDRRIFPRLSPKEEFGTCDARADIEGAAFRDETIYLIGSNSRGRKDPPNLQEFYPKCDKISGRLLSGKLEKNGDVTWNADIQIDQVLKDANFLAMGTEAKTDDIKFFDGFWRIPATENGLDIEGIAATESDLYIGFRGPIIKDKYALVLVIQRDLSANPGKGAEIRHVNLGGLGIRDIAYAKDGTFLLIAGPNGDARSPFSLYEWDGKNNDSGENVGIQAQQGKLSKLCDLGSNAEGVFVRPDSQKGKYSIIVAYDNEKDPAATVKPKDVRLYTGEIDSKLNIGN